RSGTVRGPYLHVVVEREQPLQRVVQRLRAAAEVGAADVADEERVAGEKLLPVDQPADRLRRVAGRLHGAQLDAADAQRVAVAHRAVRELRVRGGAEDDLR